MEVKLAEALASKGIIRAGTEVEAKHKVVGLGGVTEVIVVDFFSIVRIDVKKSGKVNFVLASLRDGGQSVVPAENIINIDGMDPDRFASVYNIKPDGGAAKVGVRRGRKPKDRSPEGLARAAALALANSGLVDPAN